MAMVAGGYRAAAVLALALLVLMVPMTRIAAQSADGGGTPGTGTAASMEELAGQAKPKLEAIARDFAATVDELHKKTRRALDLRGNLPAFTAVDKAAEAPANLDNAAREAKEDDLTRQIAHLKEYKFALIAVYDLVTDEVNPQGKSINALLGQYCDALEPLVRRYEEDRTDENRRILEEVLKADGSTAGPMFDSLIGSARAVLHGEVPLTPGALRSVNRPPVDGLAADAVRRVPGLFLAPMHDELRDGRFAIFLGMEFLRTLQAAIDPVEQVETRLHHEYMLLATSRLIDMDSESRGAKPADEAVDSNQTELERITRQIERRRQYRDQLLAEFRQGALRYIRQLAAVGEGDPGKVISGLLDSPDSSRKLAADTRAALDRIVDELLADQPEDKPRSPVEVAAQLEREISEWEGTLAAASGNGNGTYRSLAERLKAEIGAIRTGIIRMQLDGKTLRLRNLNEHLARENALTGVARARVVTTVQSVMMIDNAIHEKEELWASEAWSFYLWAAAKVLVIFVIAWLLIRMLRVIANRIVTGFTARVAAESGDGETDPERIRDLTQRAKTLSGVFMAAMRIVVWVTALLMVMGQLGVNYQPLLLATGGITLAIGFGAQSLVKDFFSGFFILLENQFQVGDVVELGGDVGTVESVSLRTTRLRAGDGSVHIVPNGEIKSVTNQTHGWSRIMFNVGVGYNEDPDEVRALLNRVGREMFESADWRTKLLEAPVVMGLDNFGASSLDFRIMGRTRPGEQWAATRELRRRIKIAFDLGGIEIPYNYVNYREVPDTPSKLVSRIREGREITDAKPADTAAASPDGKRKLRAADD